MSRVVWAPQCAAIWRRAAGCVDVQLDDPPALVGREQDSLAGRSERQNPVEAASDEKVDVRHERPLVEPVAHERRDGSGKCSLQHSATLSCVA